MYQQTNSRDVYREITDVIVKAVEQNAGTFEMPWHRQGTASGRPRNAQTGRAYSGVNVVALWVEAERRRYETGIWATYKQWQGLDAYVRKGEKASTVVFYKRTEREIIDDATGETKTEPYFFARASKVFNADQVQGYSAPKATSRNLVEIIKEADELVVSTGADIRHGGDRACYNWLDDYIRMPEKERFSGTSTSTPTESYYAVLFHELTHWTGHEKRLNRDFSQRFNSQSYAMEELVAELGAAFLCADLRVTNSPRPDHAAYIASWLEVMNRDAKAVFTAASKASQAADYLTGTQGRPALSQPMEEPVDAEEIPF